jgi:co-chaperonin GroES (HSP10)
VVVKFEKEPNMTETGLYLPEGARNALQEALICEVIEVASATDVTTYEETNVSGIPLGARVLIPKNSGTKVPWDDSLRIVDTKDILALVDEVTLS